MSTSRQIIFLQARKGVLAGRPRGAADRVGEDAPDRGGPRARGPHRRGAHRRRAAHGW